MKIHLLSFILGCCLAAEVMSAKLLYFKYKTKLNGLIKLSYGFSKKVGLTTDEKQSILDMTNAARHRIATGQEDNTPAGLAPNATNMMAMEWDDKLAEFAQKWADKCSTGHSPAPRFIKGYPTAEIAENFSGPTLRIDIDMYGEVHGWTYVTQECEPNKECGHYNSLVSWSYFRLGCGFKACPSTSATGVVTNRLQLFCEFAPYRSAGLLVSGERHKFQYEYWTNLKKGVQYQPGQPAYPMYAKSVPCSECPQGWDYCMKGGLCATKRQCDTDAGNNDCVCNNDKNECQRNGGTFDSANCRCKCPPDRYGLNCAKKCQNQPNAMICGITCGNGLAEIFLCHEACGSCGESVSRPYKFWMEEHPATDSENLKVRATPPMPRPAIPENVKTADLPDRGHCKNRESDYFCENIRARNYCNDYNNGAKWKHYCSASCNSCGNKEWANMIAKAMKSQGIEGSVPAVSGPSSNSGWSTSGGSGGGGWSPSGGGSSGGWGPVSGGSSDGWGPSSGGSAGGFKNVISNSGWTVGADAKEPGSSASDSWTPTGGMSSGGDDWAPTSGSSNGWTVNAAANEPSGDDSSENEGGFDNGMTY